LKAAGSQPAMHLIDEEKPAAVILDIMMPDISGLEVLRHIRHQTDLAGIPVIVVSAKSLPADIRIGLEAGASIYLTKPVGYLDLKKAVEKLLGG
jgi:DNA-binding response OmpR family regulator